MSVSVGGLKNVVIYVLKNLNKYINTKITANVSPYRVTTFFVCFFVGEAPSYEFHSFVFNPWIREKNVMYTS